MRVGLSLLFFTLQKFGNSFHVTYRFKLAFVLIALLAIISPQVSFLISTVYIAILLEYLNALDHHHDISLVFRGCSALRFVLCFYL